MPLILRLLWARADAPACRWAVIDKNELDLQIVACVKDLLDLPK